MADEKQTPEKLLFASSAMDIPKAEEGKKEINF